MYVNINLTAHIRILNVMNDLPQDVLELGFVYLDQVDPTIRQSMMYYTERNFVGQQIKGYNAPRAILTEQAAQALKKVQQDILKDGYSLVIYDAYRPQKAVQQFVEWGQDALDQKMKEFYYPNISKEEIFQLGYVATKSAHSRGSTVDLSIIKHNQEVNLNPSVVMRSLTDGSTIPYFNDNTVDMGSSVDLLDPASSHDSPLIEEQYLQNRNYLRNKMQEHNFIPYDKEWWHYTQKHELYPDVYFDFDVGPSTRVVE